VLKNRSQYVTEADHQITRKGDPAYEYYDDLEGDEKKYESYWKKVLVDPRKKDQLHSATK